MNSFHLLDYKDLSIEEKIFGISKIWKEVHYNFAYLDQISFSWDDLYLEFLSKIALTKNDYEYYKLLKCFVARLQDAHTSVYYPEHIESWLISPPIEVKEFSGKYFIVNTSTALAQTLPVGSELLGIDSKKVLSHLEEEVHPFISASTDHNLKAWGAEDILLGQKNTEVNLQIRLPGGEKSKVNVERSTKEGEEWVNPIPEHQEEVIFKKLKGEWGYLQINSFADWAVLERFKSCRSYIRACKGIILDLRNNLGGNSQVAESISKFFIDAPILQRVKSQSRKHVAAYKALGAFIKEFPESSFLPEEKMEDLYLNCYEGRVWEEEEEIQFINDEQAAKILTPLAILIGPNTASAAEGFLVTLKSADRGILVGQKTCGSTGLPLFFSLPGGGRARICSKKCTFPDGQVFVGKGIIPDVEIKPDLKSFLSSKDVVLEKAIDIISR